MTRRGLSRTGHSGNSGTKCANDRERHPDSLAQHSTVSEQDLEDVVGGAPITIENQAQASNPMVFQKPNEPKEPLQTIAW